MKRITLFFALVVGLSLSSAQAQTCSKTASACCKKSASVASMDKAGSAEAAAKLASLDESIETRKCGSGSVSYVRRETNPEGAVIFTSVEYNSDLGKFVNVSPTEMKACAKGGKTAGCCATKAKATSADAGSKDAKSKTQSGS